MKRVGVVGAAVLVGAGVVICAYCVLTSDMMQIWFPGYYRSRDEMRHLQAQIDMARRVTKIEYVAIALDRPRGQIVQLDPPRDDAYINAILRSLRRVQVIRGRWHDDTRTDEIIVAAVAGQVRLDGRFDPARAPVVSSYLRSHDLGKVVYDVCRHKGIEPRRKPG